MPSAGMGTLAEVEEALGVPAHGMTGSATPNRATCTAVQQDPAGWDLLRQGVTLLHRMTEYPAPVHDKNLRFLETLRRVSTAEVGSSDHAPGNAVSFAAVALGAKVIEKHFALDRSLPGADHAASLEPMELTALVAGIRAIGLAMNSGIKLPGKAELVNRIVARKSLIAARLRIVLVDHTAGPDVNGARILAEADFLAKSGPHFFNIGAADPKLRRSLADRAMAVEGKPVAQVAP